MKYYFYRSEENKSQLTNCDFYMHSREYNMLKYFEMLPNGADRTIRCAWKADRPEAYRDERLPARGLRQDPGEYNNADSEKPTARLGRFGRAATSLVLPYAGHRDRTIRYDGHERCNKC